MVLTNGLKKPISIFWRTATIPWEEKIEVASDREKFMWRLQETFSVTILSYRHIRTAPSSHNCGASMLKHAGEGNVM